MTLPCLLRSPLWLAVPLLLATGQACGLEFHGYLRAGAGSVIGGGGRQACFFLPGAGGKYRLGNECETFGELAVQHTLAPADGRPRLQYQAMLSAAGEGERGFGNIEEAPRHIRLQQNWLAAEIPAGGVLGGARIWAGRRYYRREDVHINDFFYWNNSGRGLGVEDVAVGSAKLAYALRRDPGNGPIATDGRAVLSHDFRLYGLKDGSGGEFTLGFDYKRAHGGGAGDRLGGYWLNALHFQDRVLGGSNKFALQYGRGAGAGLNGHPVNASDQSARTWRLVEQLLFQPERSLSGMFTVVYQDAKDSAGARAQWFSIGVRPIYHFDAHWNLATEIGHDVVRDDAGTRRLGKITVALQYSAERGFLARPVLRLFATHARWNDAARRAAAAGTPLSGSGVFGDRTRGSTLGVQFETWW